MHHHFRYFIAIIVATLIGTACTAQADSKPLTDYANPLVGTSGLIFYYGRTTPFVTPPFGMTHWTACTRSSRIGRPIYHYNHHHILGFKATHKPAMWMGDYGQVMLRPDCGEMIPSLLHKNLHFSHRNEIARPYSYTVTARTSSGSKVRIEMTATERCGILRFTFAAGTTPDIVIEASERSGQDGWIKIDSARSEITGWNSDRESAHLGPLLPHFKGYFVIQFDRPIRSYGTWTDSLFQPHQDQLLTDAGGAWLTFAEGTQLVQARVATSFISLDQARENMQKELADSTYEQIAQQTKDKWNSYLGRIQIEKASNRDRHIFYSAMYHCLLFPRQFSEYGHYYSAFDDAIHQGVSYNDYSLWDTYRAQHPLLMFIASEHVPGMVQSLIQMYREGGYMPKWPNPTYTNIMIGTHADAVVADAVVKGVKGFDLQGAYRAVMKDAFTPPDGDSIKRWGDRVPWSSYEARQGLTWYMRLGYVPVDKTAESVSSSLEYTYDDFCAAQVAKAIGQMDTYALLIKRSKNYINLYNKSTGFMAPRDSNGAWHDNPKAGFTEGSPWTYLYAAQHDISGLIYLMGGREVFLKKLNATFRGLHYIHENEPGHHFCYLYDYAGQPWMTQRRVAHYRRTKYRNSANGMNGDDDCGQMSAWYIFSSLGFYPVTPRH